jgi:hypothetical protein
MAAMRIAELEESLDNRDQETIVTDLGTLEVSDDASTVSLGAQRFLLDEQAEAAIGRYLKLEKKYVKSCDPEFKAVTLNHWIGVASEATTTFEIVNGGLVSVHSPNDVMIPVREIAAVAVRVFDPDDEVNSILSDESVFHLDVTSSRYQIEIPNPDRIPGRPEVGDITNGGVRFLAYPNAVKAPSVMGYWNRLVCTNGMSTPVKGGEVSIKGHTVEEVIQEMEHAALAVLAVNDERMARYLASASTSFPGTPQAFAFALGQEAKLSAGVMKQVMDLINQLPENASVYDVNQCFTAVANHDVNHQTMLNLQTLGGRLGLDADRMISRCATCERPLPHNH